MSAFLGTVSKLESGVGVRPRSLAKPGTEAKKSSVSTPQNRDRFESSPKGEWKPYKPSMMANLSSKAPSVEVQPQAPKSETQTSASRSVQGITDREKRISVSQDLATLGGPAGENKKEAYFRLLDGAKEADPEARRQVAEALDKLEKSGQDQDPYLKLVQAKYAAERDTNVMGPVTGNPKSESLSHLDRANQAVESQLKEGKITREEAAFLNEQAAQQYRQLGEETKAERSEMLARFSQVDQRERAPFERFNSGVVSNPLNSIPRHKDAPNPKVPSIGAPTKERQELRDWEKRNGVVQGPNGSQDLSEDPWKQTYPGQRRIETRHQRAGGGGSVLGEAIKWVQVKQRMDEATERIQTRDRLTRDAHRSERFPVPPKPEALEAEQRELERSLGREEAQRMIEEMRPLSERFWDRA